MANNDDDPISNPNPNPKLAERPPLLKKSKTIADDSRTPHFPGPLFPAVRRISTSPSSSVASEYSAASSSAADAFVNQRFGFSDRDYVYPSFLGPYSSRNRVTVKPKREVPPESLSTSRSARESVGSFGSDLVHSGRIRPESKAKHKPRPEGEIEMTAVPVQIPISSPLPSSLNSATTPSIARRPLSKFSC